MAKTKKPTEDRQQRFNRRMREAGHKQIRIWCPAPRVAELQAMVAQWREAHENQQK